MKLFSLLIFLISLVNPSFSQCDSLPLSLTIKVDSSYVLKLSKRNKFIKDEIVRNGYYVKGDSVQRSEFDISLTIKNTSDTIISIALMTCSWQNNFIINNNYISLWGEECDHNYPETIELKPGETRTYKARVSKSLELDYPCKGCAPFPPVETTRFGLIIFNDPFGRKAEKVNYFMGMEDKSKWTIVWSNPLYLLTEKQAHPEPLQFGIIERNEN